MLANLLAKRLARANIHYGWVVAGVAFLTMLATSGAVGLPGALILPLAKEFGWDVGGISSALAVRLVLFGLMGPFSAALIERYGVRNVVLTAVASVSPNGRRPTSAGRSRMKSRTRIATMPSPAIDGSSAARQPTCSTSQAASGRNTS